SLYQVDSVDRNHPLTINAGAGSDTVYVTPNGMDLSSIQDSLTVNGGGGTDSLTVDDSKDAQSANWTITPTTVTRTGAGLMTYSAFENVSIQAGTSTSDGLTGPNAFNTWNVTGTNAGTVGNATFTGIENLTGGTVGDVFQFRPAGLVAGTI